MVGHCSHCTIMNHRVNVDDLDIGARIRVGDDDLATIRYIGEIPNHPGIWVGVEWDNPERGKHNGFVDNVQYFETSYPTSGSMIRPTKIAEFESVRDAIECRYLFESLMDDQLFKETQRQIKASLFEYVPDNKNQAKDGHTNHLTTVSLPNSNISNAGDLSPFANLLVLDLTASLLRTWRAVAEIVCQLPKLEYLDLTRNRLQLPDEQEIAELEPKFRHLKSINLRRCHIRQWSTLIHIARLWPNIEKLAIAENSITYLTTPDINQIFRNLRFLDLKGNPLNNFTEVLKLGNIKTLETLYCIFNHFEKISLPDCLPDAYLDIFPNLIEINLQENHIIDQLTTFNELDKLPSLKHLMVTVNPRIGFEETFTNAIAHIKQLDVLNKKTITPAERRGAEYDIWKKFSSDWIKTRDDPDGRLAFMKTCRAYASLVKKYGAPDDLISNIPKASKFVTLKLVNANTNQATIKRVPRSITISTLQTLINKLLSTNFSSNKLPKLKYIDNDNHLEVLMDNLNKTLDYYSIQDSNTVIADWR